MIVWLASYPRSGNTLLRLMLKAVFGCDTYSKHDDANDIGANPQVAAEVGHRFLQRSWMEAYPAMRDADELHLVKTHDPPEDSGKTIYVVRDGRAACRSFHHYLRDFQHVDESYAVSDVLAGFTPAGSWSEHLDAWEPLTRPETLLLTYEDMTDDPARVIQQIASFIALPAADSWQNNFDRLHDLNPHFFRAGTENDPRTALHGKDSDIFYAAHARWMRQLNYDLPAPCDLEKAKRHYHQLLNVKVNEHFSLRTRLKCAQQRLTAQQSQIEAGSVEAVQLRASAEQADVNVHQLQLRVDEISNELEQTKSNELSLIHSRQKDTLQIQLLRNENDSGRRVGEQLRLALGAVQESLVTNQRVLEARAREIESFVDRSQNQAEEKAGLQRELQSRRAVAERLIARLERADRRLAHLRASGYQNQLELGSRIKALREQLAAEIARSAGLQIRLTETLETTRLSQAQLDSTLAAKDVAIKALAAAARELDTRLRMLLTSRFMRFGWKLGFGSVPYWDDPTKDELTGLVEVLLKKTDGAVVNVASQPNEMERALDHLLAKGFRPAVVLDIGAARGNWTRTAAARWPEAKVFMIDPLRENEAALNEISRDNRFAYLLAAVASESGEMMMNLSPDLDGSSLLKYSDSDPARQRIVPVVTVDELLCSGKVLPPQLVKIDVQGFEIEALNGGAELFRTVEVFILEVNLFRFSVDCPRAEEVVRYMADRQFVLFDVAGMLRRPFENDLGQMDLVFVSERCGLVNSNRWA